jgi:hypothetical protein
LYPASQVSAQVPPPATAPGWQTPRPGPVLGPGHGAQDGPQLASPSTWQVAAPPPVAGQSRLGALHVKPQAPPGRHAGEAFAGAGSAGDA